MLDIKLIENNASIGADIAIEYSKLRKNETSQTNYQINSKTFDKEMTKSINDAPQVIQNATFTGKKRPVRRIIGVISFLPLEINYFILHGDHSVFPGALSIFLFYPLLKFRFHT